MTKARICDEDEKTKTSYYKAMNDRKGKGQDRGNLYENKGRGNASGVRKQGNGQCYKCGEFGHKSYDCLKKGDKCFSCGKFGHKADACRAKVFCFNCGEEDHKSPACKKPRMAR
ncbi:cellular nucleic acid-binding protein [Trifolium medium]|uniref:Cellular nucleic acid-binding protein n=1 Tax=Trifolium medium TaxID=97028 RepID=A0A392RRJ2_9FABA|nr:cellular nucleic acid-binding protein [Trifolium medium]